VALEGHELDGDVASDRSMSNLPRSAPVCPSQLAAHNSSASIKAVLAFLQRAGIIALVRPVAIRSTSP
jgi:hypothetical protein